jgi:hypothetical protein
MTDFEKDYQARDLSSAYRSELARAQAGGSRGGSMHLTFAAQREGDPSSLRIVTAPIQSIVTDGVVLHVWGPVPEDCRYSTDNAGDPVRDGSLIVEPDGSWATWQKGIGYLAGTGTKPTAAFGPDGHCIQAGFTPGGRWYEVGADNEHPSTPPGMPVAGGADILTLAKELVAAIEAKG